MRLKFTPILLGLLLVGPASAVAQVWEKSLAPGMTYRMEVEPMLPRIVHSVRIVQTAPGVRAESALPKGVVYSEGATKGRGTVSEMVRTANAMGGVNGDFFPWTGDPLGLMVKSGEMISAPGSRAFFAWGKGGATIGLATITMTVTPEGGQPISITGWNEDPGVNRAGIFTPAAGSILAKVPSHRLKLTVSPSQRYGLSGEIVATVAGSETALTDDVLTPIAPGTLWIASNGTATPPFQALAEGSKVTLRYQVTGFDESKYDQAVAGGPFLVRDGQIAVDAEAQRFDDAFTRRRHPRTAVGRTQEGDLVFAVIDGRQPMSVGASLEETAAIMRRLGCVEAINLDGGGSSSLFLRGATVNRPSDNAERAIANGVVFYAPEPVPSSSSLRIRAAMKMIEGEAQALVVLDPGGVAVPHAEVIWSAQGAAWIDQGGMLRAFKEGPAEVTASVRGKLVRVSVQVAKKPVPPPKG